MLHASTSVPTCPCCTHYKCPILVHVASIYKCPSSSMLHASTSVPSRPCCTHLQVSQFVYIAHIYKCPSSSILHASTSIPARPFCAHLQVSQLVCGFSGFRPKSVFESRSNLPMAVALCALRKADFRLLSSGDRLCQVHCGCVLRYAQDSRLILYYLIREM